MWSIEIKEAVHVFFVLSVLMDIIITKLLFEYHTLKPQDSFGNFFFFFSRSSESGPYHQKAPLNPPAIVLNDML